MPRRRRTGFEAPSKDLQNGNGQTTLSSGRTANPNSSDGTQQVIRCAIYTRKSTSEGLDQAFNSLDAQREAAESYVASQKHAGWVVLRESDWSRQREVFAGLLRTTRPSAVATYC